MSTVSFTYRETYGNTIIYLISLSTFLQPSGKSIPSCGHAQHATAHSPGFVAITPASSCPHADRLRHFRKVHWRNIRPKALYRSCVIPCQLYLSSVRVSTYRCQRWFCCICQALQRAHEVVDIDSSNKIEQVITLKDTKRRASLGIYHSGGIPASAH